MLKQGIENKAAKSSDIVTVSGQVFHRRDYEDPARPGFTRAGRLYSSPELTACGLLDLTAPSGHRFSAHLPVTVTPDPTHVTRADAPVTLREAAASAWAKLEEIRARIAAVIARRDEAERAWRRAASDQNARVYNRELAASLQAEEERKALETEEPPLRLEVSRAEEAIRRWCWDEHLRRQGRAEEPAPATF